MDIISGWFFTMSNKSDFSESERALVDLIRSKTDQFRSVEIAIRAATWHVQTHVDGPEPSVMMGSGRSFSEAWNNLCDPRERFRSVH